MQGSDFSAPSPCQRALLEQREVEISPSLSAPRCRQRQLPSPTSPFAIKEQQVSLLATFLLSLSPRAAVAPFHSYSSRIRVPCSSSRWERSFACRLQGWRSSGVQQHLELCMCSCVCMGESMCAHVHVHACGCAEPG